MEYTIDELIEKFEELISEKRIEDATKLISEEAKGREENVADKLMDKGENSINEGEFDKSLIFFGAALELTEDAEKKKKLFILMAITHNNRGISYVKLGKHEKAIDDFNNAIKIDPEYEEAYNNRGISYAELGKHENAIEDFTKAIEIDPEFAEAYINRGISYFELKLYEKAIDDFTKAIEIDTYFTNA